MTLPVADGRAVPSTTQSTTETALEFFRVAGGDAALRNFVDVYVAEINDHLVSLSSALCTGKTDQARHHTHSLKNEFAIVGYDEGVAICEALSIDLRNARYMIIDLADIERAITSITKSLAAVTGGPNV